MTENVEETLKRKRYRWHCSQQFWHELQTKNLGWHRYQASWHKKEANKVWTFNEIVSQTFKKNLPKIVANVFRNNILLKRIIGKCQEPPITLESSEEAGFTVLSKIGNANSGLDQSLKSE